MVDQRLVSIMAINYSPLKPDLIMMFCLNKISSVFFFHNFEVWNRSPYIFVDTKLNG